MTKQEQCRAYLTGHVPLSLRGEEIQVPTDTEIRDFVLTLSAADQTKIVRGPNGDKFTRRVNDALSRVQAQIVARKPAPMGSIATSFVDFAPHEVNDKDTSPRKFKSDENE
jgi:hypothetical protein